ncbi:MAG: TolC family protein [Bacteroidia bacterium]
MRRFFKIIFTCFTFSLANSQEVLLLSDAIKIGLEKNYAILSAKNNVIISGIQNNMGNAGMSPQIGINGNLNLARINSHQEFSSGVVQDRTGAGSSNLGGSLYVSWVVFDGMKMFAIKKRLVQNEELNKLQLKLQIENIVFEIIVGYYDIVRIKSLIKAVKQSLLVVEERMKITKAKLDAGSASKVDLLLTQAEENKTKADQLKLEQQLAEAKAKLSTILVRSADSQFDVEDTIQSNYQPGIEDLKKTSAKSNSSIRIALQNELIANQSILESKSNLFPQLQLNGAYSMVRNQSQAGFVFLNNQAGFNGGVSLSWIIFNGSKNRKLIQESKLAAFNKRLLTEELKQNIDAMVYIDYQRLLSNQKILALEKQNFESAKELLSIGLERYRVGKGNLLEVREVQKAFVEAQTSLINSLFEVKKAETALLKANGDLVK